MTLKAATVRSVSVMVPYSVDVTAPGLVHDAAAFTAAVSLGASHVQATAMRHYKTSTGGA